MRAEHTWQLPEMRIIFSSQLSGRIYEANSGIIGLLLPEVKCCIDKVPDYKAVQSHLKKHRSPEDNIPRGFSY
jgi:hypothetical protein